MESLEALDAQFLFYALQTLVDFLPQFFAQKLVLEIRVYDAEGVLAEVWVVETTIAADEEGGEELGGGEVEV